MPRLLKLENCEDEQISVPLKYLTGISVLGLSEIILNVYSEYLLALWSRVLLEKLTGSQPVTKFPIFYGTRKFITALTSARFILNYI